MNVEHYGERRDRLWFECPRRPGHFCCVLLKPWPIEGACTWNWDGNRENPTLSPSINCSGPGCCGWHGFVKSGQLINA